MVEEGRSTGEWCVLSRDINLRRRKAERDALLQSGLIVFFFARKWANARFEEQALKIWEHWSQIMECAREASARREQGDRSPIGYEVPFQGRRKIRPSRRLG